MCDEVDSQAAEIRAAELARIRSEVARNDAERTRLQIEADTLRAQLHRKWYQGRFVIEGIIGGTVAAGLLAAWFIGFFQPLLRSEQDLANLENRKLSIENQLQEARNEQITESLESQNRTVARQLDQLREQNKSLAAAQEASTEIANSLEEKLSSLQAEYATLSTAKELSDEERIRFADLSRSSEARLVSVQEEISRLRASRSETIARAAEVRAQQVVGEWYGVWAGDRNTYPYQFSLNDAGRLTATWPRNPEAQISAIKLDGDNLVFRLIDGGRDISFDLNFTGRDRMEGTAKEVGRESVFPYEMIRDTVQ